VSQTTGVEVVVPPAVTATSVGSVLASPSQAWSGIAAATVYRVAGRRSSSRHCAGPWSERLPPSPNVIGSQMYGACARSAGVQRSPMKRNRPAAASIGITDVLCDENVSDAPGPLTGFPWSVHSPRIDSAVA